MKGGEEKAKWEDFEDLKHVLEKLEGPATKKEG